MSLRAFFRMLGDSIRLPHSDGRMLALEKYALAAFGFGHSVTVYALSNDRWAWARGEDDCGFAVNLDVRCGPAISATAALAAAMQCLSEQRGALQAQKVKQEEPADAEVEIP